MMYTRRWSALVVGILLMGLCVGVTGARAQTIVVAVEITSATVNTAGVVTVSGVVTCTADVPGGVGINVEVVQPVGRTKSVSGSTFNGVPLGPCGPSTQEEQPFSVQVFPTGFFEGVFTGGRFGPGTAFVFTDVFALDCCFEDVVTSTTVRLTRSP